MADTLRESGESQLYDRFPYPPLPDVIETFEDPLFWSRMLAHDVGRWGERDAPARIWVAGCGTIQPIHTALRFPNAAVVGTDVSVETIEVAQRIARQLEIKNLELAATGPEQASASFDYIICTGVLHHTADPGALLRRIAAAMKPDALLEVMVYNQYHRAQMQGFQRALRLLCPSAGLDEQLAVGRGVARQLERSAGFLTHLIERHYRHLGLFPDPDAIPDEIFADQFVQPLERGYTIESFFDLCEESGLEVQLPCPNRLDQAHHTLDWNLRFDDPALDERYLALPLRARWQTTNLLHAAASPRIWFYLRKARSPLSSDEAGACASFLDQRLLQASTVRHDYRLRSDGRYVKCGEGPYPGPPVDAEARRVWDTLRPGETIREALKRSDVASDWRSVNRLRVQLSTRLCPFLDAR